MEGAYFEGKMISLVLDTLSLHDSQLEIMSRYLVVLQICDLRGMFKTLGVMCTNTWGPVRSFRVERKVLVEAKCKN